MNPYFLTLQDFIKLCCINEKLHKENPLLVMRNALYFPLYSAWILLLYQHIWRTASISQKNSTVNIQMIKNQIKVWKYAPQRCDNRLWFWKAVQISCRFYSFSPNTFHIICIKTEVLDHLQKHEKSSLLPVQTDTQKCIAFSFLLHFLRWSHHPPKKKMYLFSFKTEMFHWMGFSLESCLL